MFTRWRAPASSSGCSLYRSGGCWRPLVALGTISYGVYLYHWPVYVVLDEQRASLPDAALLAVRLGLTLILAVVSFRLLERPIRVGGLRRPAITGLAACSSWR